MTWSVVETPLPETDKVDPGPPVISKFPLIVTLLLMVMVLLFAMSTNTFPVKLATPLAIWVHSKTVAPPVAVQVIEAKLVLLDIVVGLEVHVFCAKQILPHKTKKANIAEFTNFFIAVG